MEAIRGFKYMNTHTHTLSMALDMGFMPISAPPQDPITHWGPLWSLLSISSWCVSSFQPLQRKRCRRSPTVSVADQIHSLYTLQLSAGFGHSLLRSIHWNLRAVDGAHIGTAHTIQPHSPSTCWFLSSTTWLWNGATPSAALVDCSLWNGCPLSFYHLVQHALQRLCRDQPLGAGKEEYSISKDTNWHH